MHRSDKTNRWSFVLAAEVTIRAHRRTKFAARSSETVMLPSYWNGGSTEPPVLFDSRPATLNVRLDEVDYADGSSWTAPASH
jgi:hypothetical protein